MYFFWVRLRSCLIPSFRAAFREVLPALLEVLNSVSTTENKILAKAPAGVMAMLLAILALTGAGSFKKESSNFNDFNDVNDSQCR